jgi:hypothetical protein
VLLAAIRRACVFNETVAEDNGCFHNSLGLPTSACCC